MDTHQIKIRQNQRQTKEYERYYKELRSAEIAENEKVQHTKMKINLNTHWERKRDTGK